MDYTCLDLFCGAGGAAKGLSEAGFAIIHGVDIAAQPNYPFYFYQNDFQDLTINQLQEYDFIWASPPCQNYSFASKRHRNAGKEYPDYIGKTRDLLKKSEVPYIIENVVGAPLINPVRLCGTMFPELRVFRHRLFESNIPITVPMKCSHEGHKAIEYRYKGGDFYIVAGHMPGTLQEWSNAMGIYHMKTKKELAESIPPAYSKYLGLQVIEWLNNSNK